MDGRTVEAQESQDCLPALMRSINLTTLEASGVLRCSYFFFVEQRGLKSLFPLVLCSRNNNNAIRDIMNTTYRVVIKGVKDGVAEEQVAAKLSALFKTSEEQARKILASGAFPVKKGLDLQTAAKYQAAIEATGASVIVEPEEAPKAVAPEIEKANIPASTAEAPRATVEKSETVAPISNEPPAVLPINNGNAAVKAKLIDINNLSARDVIKATAIILILGFMGAMVFINANESPKKIVSAANSFTSKKASSTTTFNSSEDLYRVSDGHLILSGRIGSDIKQPMTFTASSNGYPVLELTLQNGWLISRSLRYNVTDKGQTRSFNSPDFDCIGFDKEEERSLSNSPGRENILLCQSQDTVTKTTKSWTSNEPIGINLSKGEIFYLQESTHSQPPLLLRLSIKN